VPLVIGGGSSNIRSGWGWMQVHCFKLLLLGSIAGGWYALPKG
jgi:hypothetical protein